MASSVFNEYDKKYPNLIMDIPDYFNLNNANTRPIEKRSIHKFCTLHQDKFNVIYILTVDYIGKLQTSL